MSLFKANWCIIGSFLKQLNKTSASIAISITNLTSLTIYNLSALNY